MLDCTDEERLTPLVFALELGVRVLELGWVQILAASAYGCRGTDSDARNDDETGEGAEGTAGGGPLGGVSCVGSLPWRDHRLGLHSSDVRRSPEPAEVAETDDVDVEVRGRCGSRSGLSSGEPRIGRSPKLSAVLALACV